MGENMSRRKRKYKGSNELSLVPLADMLTNTVGVVVFILIFTVLTAGGAVIIKHLPMEHQVALENKEYYICMEGRLFPLRDELIDRVLKMDRTPDKTRDGLRAAAQLLNGRSAADDNLKLALSAKYEDSSFQYGIDLEFTCSPARDGGLGSLDIHRSDGFFAKDLKRLQSNKTALIFWVKPDGIGAFSAAREFAIKNGFSYNWSPRDGDKPLTFVLTSGDGGGGTITVH
jgi:hypothetical protein